MPNEVGLRGYRIKDHRRFVERRRSILVAAASVFKEKGYQSATLDDVAERLGTSRGVIYYQFRSKEEIYVEILTTTELESAARLKSIIDRGDGPRETLRAALDDLVAVQFEEPNFQSNTIGRPNDLRPESRARIREADLAYRSLLLRLVERGISAGLLAPRDPKLTAFTLIHAAQSVSHWWREGGPLTAATITPQLTDMLMNMCLAHPEDGTTA